MGVKNMIKKQIELSEGTFDILLEVADIVDLSVDEFINYLVTSFYCEKIVPYNMFMSYKNEQSKE